MNESSHLPRSRHVDLKLELMPQLSEMRTPDDDWTGKTKAEERRRRQNRLNQRTYRRRKMLQPASSPSPPPSEGIMMLETPEYHAKMYEFMKQVYIDHSLRATRPTYLPALIRLNVLNALGHNGAMMGMDLKSLCRDEALSPFVMGPMPVMSCPENLLPTTKQLTVRHHPWLDLFPFPRMRDNMIEGADSGVFDDDVLCHDIIYTGDGFEVEKPALIVWGESWDVRGWEVSVAFLRKWGWLVRGCPEIIKSTNYWREKRGERKLINVEL